MGVEDEFLYQMTVETNEHGMCIVDPFEVIYFIRSGIQQLMLLHSVAIDHICIGVMPGYVFAWDTESCRPVSDCLASNNSLPSDLFQRFKFSSFYQLLKEHPDQLSIDANLSVNL